MQQDGFIDFREYVLAISMLLEGSSVEKLRWSFKLYDKDKDGAITRSEMLDIMQVGSLDGFASLQYRDWPW